MYHSISTVCCSLTLCWCSFQRKSYGVCHFFPSSFHIFSRPNGRFTTFKSFGLFMSFLFLFVLFNKKKSVTFTRSSETSTQKWTVRDDYKWFNFRENTLFECSIQNWELFHDVIIVKVVDWNVRVDMHSAQQIHEWRRIVWEMRIKRKGKKNQPTHQGKFSSISFIHSHIRWVFLFEYSIKYKPQLLLKNGRISGCFYV